MGNEGSCSVRVCGMVFFGSVVVFCIGYSTELFRAIC